MPKRKTRREVEPARLKASIIELLTRRYGEDGDNVPRLGLPDDEKIERRVRELVKFYKTTWPDAQGRQPQVNIWYVMAPSGYAKDSLELDKLLHEEIAAAKRPATRLNRENRALQLIGEIFDQGWRRDWKTGEMVIEVPPKPKVWTKEEKENHRKQARMVADAMWRRGSRDS
jgi:hypothetical protein